MPSQSQTTVKALGLNINPNFLDLPNGSLVVADDVIIRRENVVESRRGIYNWSAGFGSSVDRANQLLEYKNRILANYSDKLCFETGETDLQGKAVMEDFDGVYSPPSVYRMRFIEANKNLYFTTSDGIKKISATSADEFTSDSGYIKDAGAVKAIDFTTNLKLQQGQVDGFLPIDSGVAYRHIWGYKDVNDNTILGAPSTRNIVYNYSQLAFIEDFNRLLLILDIFGALGTASVSNTLLTDTDYYSTLALTSSSSGTDLKTNLINLCRKLDSDLLLGNQTGTGSPFNPPLTLDTIAMNAAGTVTLTVSSGTVTDYISEGDYINLQGITTSDITIFNNNFLVTNTGTSVVEFQYTDFVAGSTGSIATTSLDASTTLNSYNYTQITESGNGNTFTQPLSDILISFPITAGQIATLNDTLSRVVDRLSVELPDVISATLISDYLDDYALTESGNVQLKISIPTDSQNNQLDSSYFLQVYRSNVFEAFQGSQSSPLQLGVTVIPDDELHLVYEYFPNSTDFSNGYVEFLDTYPDSLAQNNTPLYTNPVTGDGILQSNDLPPLSQDINYFNGYTFYSNTKTKHIIPNLQLIGVENIVSGQKVTIANDDTYDTYTFVDGVNQITEYTVTAASAAALKTAIQNNYFEINSANNVNSYYIWFRYDGTGTDPLVANKIGVPVDLITGDTVALMCQRTAETLNNLIFDFSATNGATTITITNADAGTSTAPSIGNISGSNLAVSVTTTGVGENVSTKQVLISRGVSAAQNIDLTARSFIRVINGQSTSPVYAYYLSGDNTSPGQIALINKLISDTPFYVIGSNPQFNSVGGTGIGNSFIPDISPIHVVTGSTIVDGPSGYVTFTTPTAHGLQNGNKVLLTNTNCNPILDGVYIVYNVTATTFDIQHTPVLVGSGTRFSWELTTESVVSTNTTKPNRVYYSKFNQPEAVPLLNYFDIGPEDKAVLRIFPLRTTLFVFKEDGLYRISGQTAPFSVQLFDSSCVLIAPDTVDVADNTLFCWTTKGITNVNESGTNEISNPIDIEILKLATYPDFRTLTWGIGYNSDNSYTVFTNKLETDTTATIGFRFSTLTNTWTNIQRSQTCGILANQENVLYFGDGTDNIVDKERKSFTRTDFADEEYILDIEPTFVNATGNQIKFPDVSDIEIGDVLYQEQYLTIYKFNALLRHLDSDPTVSDDDYFSTLEAEIGDDLRSKILALSLKLDTDPGLTFTTYNDHITTKTLSITGNSVANPTVVTTSSISELVDDRIITISGTQSPSSILEITGQHQIFGTGTWGSSSTFNLDIDVTTPGGTGLNLITNSDNFLDVQACFNALVTMLNNDPGATYTNYQTVDVATPIEAVVIAVNRVSKTVTLNITGQWVVGPVTLYKAIPMKFIYAPLTFGDVLKLKQVFGATAMFSATNFTSAKLSFSSDLKPAFTGVSFNNYGNGIFGSYSNPGFGFGYFGGGGNAKPFRTIIPYLAQRCRYINMMVEHRVAREIIAHYGVTLTANIGQSSGAYR